MSRKYEPIWEKIKRDGFCKIAAPKPLHARIIKAVVKEKYNDTAFKFLAAESWRWNRLTHTINGNEIVFTLAHEKSIGDL